MNREEFYFNEELKKENLNNAFDQVSSGFDSRVADALTSGIIYGFGVPTAHTSFTMTFGAGVAHFNGQRIDGSLGVSALITTDFAGASTYPAGGNYRWVSIGIRYGQLLSNSATDGLGNTVYKTRTDSYNLNGTSLAADATAAANNAGDAKLYVLAGAQAAIGSPLTLPTLPTDAVLLADVLITFGETEINYAVGAVFYGRRKFARRAITSPMGFPGDPSISRWDYQLIGEMDGRSIKTRFYSGFAGLVITQNAAWSGDTTIPAGIGNTWTADNTGYPATKYSLFNGTSIFTMERKFVSDVGTPWTDQTNNTAGWDAYMAFGSDSVRSSFCTIDSNGNTVGNGVQLGYISALTMAATLLWNTIQFPRAFPSTPSSVTLGAAGPSETNVNTIVLGNLNPYGCDFRVAPSNSAIACVAQRVYTATL